MEERELDLLLEFIAVRLRRLVANRADDPELMAEVDALREKVICEAGPGHAERVRAWFGCLLGSFGLIPSDNEGEPCG